MKITRCLIAAILVFAGCTTSQPALRYDVLTLVSKGPKGNKQAPQWFNMAKDSNFHKTPVAPQGLDPLEEKDYIAGYNAGWGNTADSCLVGIIPGDKRLYFARQPGLVAFNKETKAIKQGMKDGTAQARIDFNAFCLDLETKLNMPNPPFRTIDNPSLRPPR